MTNDTPDELEILRAKIKRADGFLRFLNNDDDPSHTLRAPVVSMKSFLDIIEMSNYSMDPEEMKELSVEVNRSLDRLLQIIEDIFKEE
jgi:signal transduction histidine kinase